MKYYSINETITTKQDQNYIRINKPFINDITSVFVNGNLKAFGEDKDYTTIQDTGKIFFNEPLNENDIVQVVSNVLSPSINIEVVASGHADRKNTLFRKYSSEKRIKLNNIYNISLCIDKEFVDWSFASQLSPMFATVKQVRNQIGDFIKTIEDDQINEINYKNSIEVIELIDQLANQDDPVENVTYEQNSDGIYDTTYRAVKNWVLYKSCIDLIYYIYYGIAINYGSIKKQIGDITIEKSTKLPYLDQLLDRLKDLWDDADAEIKGINFVASFVKGIDLYKYDDWARDTLF